MEERDNKTIMCSVLFLDIVEYSKKSVSGQISLKDRFNSYLSAAIRDVPVTDRIILDTGDGAAINFLGDVEDALKTALSLRESLLNEGIDVDPPLLVRMGINLGPVRLVRDINGQPNIVGDGINVAQRVMGFADVAQILVSRSYYDAVSRLSTQYAGMFHYQGSRTDKHVREHEVYAIGYPGDKTIQRGKTPSAVAEKDENTLASALERAKTVWRFAASRLDKLIEHLVNSFRQAEPKQRALYVGVAAVPLVLIIVLLVSLVRHDEIPAAPGSTGGQAEDTIQPGSAVAPVSAGADAKTHGAIPGQFKAAPKPETQKITEGKKPKDKTKRPEGQAITETKPKTITETKPKTKDNAAEKAAVAAPGDSAGTFVSVRCKGAEVFVDGTRKGRISSSPLTIEVSPGKHAVIVSHAKGVYSQDIVFDAGKTVRLDPDFCDL
ncbi:MAG: adenylate/guanylate cyclase domain-containing protein [Gallionella sp.]|nr:adenylate/guanylate cyclase domain-containing protein [Gallionella sp.]